MSEKQQQVSVDINYSPDVAKGVGLQNIMIDVSQNMAYRLEQLIQKQDLAGKPLKIVATLTADEVTPADRWVQDENGCHWEQRK